MTYAITEPAERDIEDILTQTLKVFGPHQLALYEHIIATGLAMVGEDPECGGSIARTEIADGVRVFHLELAAGRRAAAAHCLYIRLAGSRMVS